MAPKITLAMLMCGIGAATAAGVAAAATPDPDVLAIAVKYDPRPSRRTAARAGSTRASSMRQMRFARNTTTRTG